MKQKFHYGTVTEAIEQLHKQGYTLDFNLKEDKLVVDNKSYPVDGFGNSSIMKFLFHGKMNLAGI